MGKNKALLVIDMQVDFVTGTLANEEAQRIIGAVESKIRRYQEEGLPVFFTRDTHDGDYMQTQEGRMLPVQHCIRGSEGWQIVPELRKYAEENAVLDKPAFGCMELPIWLMDRVGSMPEEIEVIGVCTDICVISNCMILKAAFPETLIRVDSACCAGVSCESHANALEAMKACQIIVE
ncbi:MAG: cysteine hydrolase family protein [Emergencia sp.]